MCFTRPHRRVCFHVVLNSLYSCFPNYLHMRNQSLVLLPLLLLFLFSAPIRAQKVKTVKVEATEQIQIENGMTIEEAKYLALLKAREQALENVFGRDIYQGNVMTIDEQSGEITSVSESYVKGSWVSTSSESCEKVIDSRGNVWMRCTVKGRAKALTKPPIYFIAEPLDCPDKRCKTSAFLNDEDFFVYFRSPVRGYVAAYLMMEDQVQCLLPYDGMEGSSRDIEADKEYVLFSEKQAPDYFMFTEKNMETCLLIVIFSPNDFSKPILNEDIPDSDHYELPKQLSIEEFQKWLGRQRAAYEDLEVKNIVVTISKN